MMRAVERGAFSHWLSVVAITITLMFGALVGETRAQENAAIVNPAMLSLANRLTALRAGAGNAPQRANEDQRILTSVRVGAENALKGADLDATGAAGVALTANLATRLSQLSEAERSTLLGYGSKGMSAWARDELHVVAFGTLADDATLADAGGVLKYHRRTEADGPRTLTGAAPNWVDLRARYTIYLQDKAAYETAFNTFNNTPEKVIYGQHASKTRAQMTRDDLIDIAKLDKDSTIELLAKRLTSIFDAAGQPLEEGLAADLARIQYLLMGWELDGNGDPVRVAEGLLTDLEVEASNRTLDKAMQELERENDFQRGYPIPTGIISSADFNRSVYATYFLNDLGAGPSHGAATHRIQWQVIMRDYKENAAAYNNPPSVIYSKIGQQGLEAEDRVSLAGDGNRAQFVFENLPIDLWGHLFDRPGLGEPVDTLSRPDGVRTALGRKYAVPGEGGVRLPVIANHQAREYVDRAAGGIRAANEYLLAKEAGVTTPRQDEIVADAEAEIKRLLRGKQSRGYDHLIGDALWQEQQYDKMRASGSFEQAMVRENGVDRDVRILIKKDTTLARKPKRRALRRQKDRHKARQSSGKLGDLPIDETEFESVGNDFEDLAGNDFEGDNILLDRRKRKRERQAELDDPDADIELERSTVSEQSEEESSSVLIASAPNVPVNELDVGFEDFEDSAPAPDPDAPEGALDGLAFPSVAKDEPKEKDESKDRKKSEGRKVAVEEGI